MKKTLAVVALALIVAAPVSASTVSYELSLGGDPHKGANPVAYTPGSTADGFAVPEGTHVINWAVSVAASGEFNGVGILGVANTVFDIQLLKDGVPVEIGAGSATEMGFFSAINDGTGDSEEEQSPYGTGPYPLLAAFTYVFDVDGPGGAPGRIFDEGADNGPHLVQRTYPTAEGFCVPSGACSTAPLGSLVGMGAGYQTYLNAGSLGAPERAGVGMNGVLDEFGLCSGLGNGPIAEGQINLTGLTTGTYELKVIAGNGNNVLRGDFSDCESGTSGNFAVKADEVIGDSITFTYIGTEPGCTVAPALVSAVSRRTHGAAGTFDVPLPGAGAVGVEPRQNGPQLIVLTYDMAIGGTPVVTLSTGTLGAVTMSGSELSIAMSGVADGSCVSIDVQGVTCDLGSGPTASNIVKVRSVFGDINGNGSVNVADIGLVKARSGTAVDAASFRTDLNGNGSINVADVGLVKSRSGVITAAPCTN